MKIQVLVSASTKNECIFIILMEKVASAHPYRKYSDGVCLFGKGFGVIRTNAGRGLPSKMDCVQTHGAASRPHVEPLREAVRSVVMDPVLHTSGVL